MCIFLTPVLYFNNTVIKEVYLQCFTESVSLRDNGLPTSRAEISSPRSLYLKAVKGAHIGSALNGATSELTSSNRKKNSYKTHYSLSRNKTPIKTPIKTKLLIFKHRRKNVKNFSRKAELIYLISRTKVIRKTFHYFPALLPQKFNDSMEVVGGLAFRKIATDNSFCFLFETEVFFSNLKKSANQRSYLRQKINLNL